MSGTKGQALCYMLYMHFLTTDHFTDEETEVHMFLRAFSLGRSVT